MYSSSDSNTILGLNLPQSASLSKARAIFYKSSIFCRFPNWSEKRWQGVCDQAGCDQQSAECPEALGVQAFSGTSSLLTYFGIVLFKSYSHSDQSKSFSHIIHVSFENTYHKLKESNVCTVWPSTCITLRALCNGCMNRYKVIHTGGWRSSKPL